LLAVEVDAAVVGADVEAAEAAGVPAEGILTPHDPPISLPLGRRAEAKRLLDLLRVARRPHSLGPARPDSLGPARPDSLRLGRRHSLGHDQRVELRVQPPRRDSVQRRVPVLRIALPEAVPRLGS
jgi:hypothetical protein